MYFCGKSLEVSGCYSDLLHVLTAWQYGLDCFMCDAVALLKRT